MIEGVPYRSQWVSPECVGPILAGEMAPSDDPRWREFGADDPAEYDFWSGRVCGLTCLEMVLDLHGITHGSTMELALLAERYGAYVRHDHGVRGLVYEPFTRLVRDHFGLTVSVHSELGLEQLRAVLEQGMPTIASVHPSIREAQEPAGGRGGHLVLCLGVEGSDIVFHNPSGDRPGNQAHARVRTDDFARFFGGRGMVVEKARPGPATSTSCPVSREQAPAKRAPAPGDLREPRG